MADSKLRFGVVCAGDHVEAASAAAIRALLDSEGVELELVIAGARPPARETGGALWRLYQTRLRRPVSGEAHVDLSDLFAGVRRVPQDDAAAIRERRLDFILHLGAGQLRDEILELPRHGVWSFHYGDERSFRGHPRAFWETHHGCATTGATLQRLTGRLHAGGVLQRCSVQTSMTSYPANLDSLLWATTHMPARVARDLLNGCADYLGAGPSDMDGPVRHPPTNRQMAVFLAKTTFRWLRQQLASVIYAEEHWHVGMIRQPIHSLLNPGVRHRIEWLPFRRANRYMADPFAIRVGPTTKLLMEEYDYSSRRGIIVESELTDGGGWSPPRPVLRAERHMAYPYLFEHRGEIWCTPENQDIRGVALYAWDRERRRWSHHDVILHDFPAVDPTIIRHGGHWWLFCTSRDDYPQAKLFLWQASDLTGPWEPHPGNPVKVDVRSSRPAGTPFEFEGQLYRPAQDCSETYGGGITINRVTRLTPVAFAEEPVATIEAGRGSDYAAGIHTLSGSGELTMLDGKRVALAPALVPARLLHKVRRAGQVARQALA